LRTNREAWVMQNDVTKGVVSCMQVDPSRYWMVVGTMTGNICGWDLRFRLPFREWRTQDQSCVRRISTVSSRLMLGSNSSIFVTSGPSYFHLLDLEQGQSRWYFERKPCFYRSSTNGSSAPTHNLAVESIGVPARIPLLLNMANSYDSVLIRDEFGIQNLSLSQYQSGTPIRALVNPPDTTYIITAGTDYKIRYWDLEQPATSYIISGRSIDEPQPKYSTYVRNNQSIFEEEPSISVPLTEADKELKPHPSMDFPSINHHDCITSLQCLEFPTQMLISASRDGVIKVWK